MGESDKQLDLDKNGQVTSEEVTAVTTLTDNEIKEEKADAQKAISIVAMSFMIIVTLLLLAPVIPESRISVLSDLLSMLYISFSSVIGFYFGASAYMSK